MTATTSNETKPEAGKATESIQETALTQATESPEQPPLKAQPTGPLVPPDFLLLFLKFPVFPSKQTLYLLAYLY